MMRKEFHLGRMSAKVDGCPARVVEKVIPLLDYRDVIYRKKGDRRWENQQDS